MIKTEETRRIVVDNMEMIYTGAPRTHVFYEYQGERAVDPLQLVMDGEVLWSEQAHNNLEHKHEVLRLWGDAEDLLAKPLETLTQSYVEWLRNQITLGVFDPKKSRKQKRPYAYRSMLVSAIYLQEARRLCAQGDNGRVWHILTTAYYHLGLSTTPSTRQLTARASKAKHKEAVDVRKALALVPLEIIREQQKIKQTIKNVEDAIDAVIRLIHSNKKALAELEQVDALTPNRDENNDALDRFRNLLVKWASPDGPHPEIIEAFAEYDQRKRAPKMKSGGPQVRGEAIDPNDTNYMRLVNIFEDGNILTFELSSGKPNPDADSRE